MKLVKSCSFACANHFATVMNENHQKRAVYYFGFQVVLGAVVKGAMLIVSGLLFGILAPLFLIAFTFGSFRMLAGGYHMDTYEKCLVVSLVLFILAGLTAQYTYTYWNIYLLTAIIAFTALSGLYALVRYAPKDTPNKRITDPEDIRKFKTLSIICFWVLVTIISLLAFTGLRMAALAINFGLLLELFTITPTGHRFFDAIKEGFGKKGKD